MRRVENNTNEDEEKDMSNSIGGKTLHLNTVTQLNKLGAAANKTNIDS